MKNVSLYSIYSQHLEFKNNMMSIESIQTDLNKLGNIIHTHGCFSLEGAFDKMKEFVLKIVKNLMNLLKRFWNWVKRIFGRGEKINKIVKIINNDNDIFIYDNIKTVEELNDHYKSDKKKEIIKHTMNCYTFSLLTGIIHNDKLDEARSQLTEIFSSDDKLNEFIKNEANLLREGVPRYYDAFNKCKEILSGNIDNDIKFNIKRDEQGVIGQFATHIMLPFTTINDFEKFKHVYMETINSNDNGISNKDYNQAIQFFTNMENVTKNMLSKLEQQHRDISSDKGNDNEFLNSVKNDVELTRLVCNFMSSISQLMYATIIGITKKFSETNKENSPGFIKKIINKIRGMKDEDFVMMSFFGDSEEKFSNFVNQKVDIPDSSDLDLDPGEKLDGDVKQLLDIECKVPKFFFLLTQHITFKVLIRPGQMRDSITKTKFGRIFCYNSDDVKSPTIKKLINFMCSFSGGAFTILSKTLADTKDKSETSRCLYVSKSYMQDPNLFNFIVGHESGHQVHFRNAAKSYSHLKHMTAHRNYLHIHKYDEIPKRFLNPRAFSVFRVMSKFNKELLRKGYRVQGMPGFDPDMTRILVMTPITELFADLYSVSHNSIEAGKAGFNFISQYSAVENHDPKFEYDLTTMHNIMDEISPDLSTRIKAYSNAIGTHLLELHNHCKKFEISLSKDGGFEKVVFNGKDITNDSSAMNSVIDEGFSKVMGLFDTMHTLRSIGMLAYLDDTNQVLNALILFSSKIKKDT